jgi:hypothetical protein
MSEAGMWDTMRDKLARLPDLTIMRVENVVCDGTPDVNYCLGGVEGWIELKHRADPPKREATPVFPDGLGLRFAQKLWLAERAASGGRCWIMSRVGRGTWLIHHGSWAFTFNHMSMKELEETATWWARGGQGLGGTSMVRLMREVFGNPNVGLVLPKGARVPIL